MDAKRPKKALAVMVLLCCLFGCALAIPHPIQRSGNNTKCAYPKLPTGYLAVGKSVSVPGDCMQITCQNDLTLSGLTCPSYTLFSGCNLTETVLDKGYPDCCPQLRCSEYGQRPPFKREVAALTSGAVYSGSWCVAVVLVALVSGPLN